MNPKGIIPILAFSIVINFVLFTSSSWAEHFGTPEFSQGIPYSEFSKHLTNEILRKYFLVWKRQFQSANKINDEDFERKVLLISVSNDGYKTDDDFIMISYFVKIDWYKAQVSSFNLPIMMSPSRDEYKHILPRRGVYFSDEEIIKYLEAGNDFQLRFRLNEPLAIKTKEDAETKLTEAVEGNSIPTGWFRYWINNDGDPIISTIVTVDSKSNHCKGGEINVITGKIDVRKTRCRVY